MYDHIWMMYGTVRVCSCVTSHTLLSILMLLTFPKTLCPSWWWHDKILMTELSWQLFPELELFSARWEGNIRELWEFQLSLSLSGIFAQCTNLFNEACTVFRGDCGVQSLAHIHVLWALVSMLDSYFRINRSEIYIFIYIKIHIP